jgi:hypothetical protein
LGLWLERILGASGEEAEVFQKYFDWSWMERMSGECSVPELRRNLVTYEIINAQGDLWL